MEDVIQYILAGNKIEAIKRYREVTRAGVYNTAMGLKKAKDHVETIQLALENGPRHDYKYQIQIWDDSDDCWNSIYASYSTYNCALTQAQNLQRVNSRKKYRILAQKVMVESVSTTSYSIG